LFVTDICDIADQTRLVAICVVAVNDAILTWKDAI
jgi:hypothetical protein